MIVDASDTREYSVSVDIDECLLSTCRIGHSIAFANCIYLGIYQVDGIGSTLHGSKLYYLNTVNVPSRFRKQGIGTTLIKNLLNTFEDWDSSVILVCDISECDDTFPLCDLKNWYKKLGFVEMDDSQYYIVKIR